MEHISKYLATDASAPPTNSGSHSAAEKVSSESSAISLTWLPADRDRAERLLATLRDPTAPGATQTLRGVPLSDVTPGDRLSTDDAIYLAGRCTRAFGRDFTEAETLYNARVWDVWQQCERDGWTSEAFRRAVDRFIGAERFDTWTPADFFSKGGRPMIYGHKWYSEQIAAGRGAEVGAYLIVRPCGDRQVVWGWREECDGILSEYVFQPKARPMLTDREPESGAVERSDIMAPELREQWDATKEAEKARSAFEEQSRLVSRLRSERLVDQRRIEYLEAEIDALRKQRDSLADPRGQTPEVAP